MDEKHNLSLAILGELGPDSAVDVLHLAETDSTNSRLKQLNAEGRLSRPTIMTTDHQYGGRGTRGRSWEQVQGRDIALTLALPASRPDLTDPRLSLAIGAITAAALETSIGSRESPGPKITLKWPNDILAGDPPKKCGGILLEQSHNWIFIGIGVNVNSTILELPEDLRRTSTTLKDMVGRDLDRRAIAVSVARELAAELGLIGAGKREGACEAGLDYECLMREWRRRDRTGGTRYTLLREGGLVVTAAGVLGETGELTVVDDGGREHQVSSYTDLERLED